MPTERPIKMIETGKHSAFRGTLCNKDYTMRRVFLSTVLRANDIFLLNITPLMSASVVSHSGEKEYKSEDFE